MERAKNTGWLILKNSSNKRFQLPGPLSRDSFENFAQKENNSSQQLFWVEEPSSIGNRWALDSYSIHKGAILEFIVLCSIGRSLLTFLPSSILASCKKQEKDSKVTIRVYMYIVCNCAGAGGEDNA